MPPSAYALTNLISLTYQSRKLIGHVQCMAALKRSNTDLSERGLDVFTLFCVLQIVDRLHEIARRIPDYGWIKRSGALFLDQAGADHETVRQLAHRGAELCVHHPLTRDLADWFPQVADALCLLEQDG